jgi:hypothetical protein
VRRPVLGGRQKAGLHVRLARPGPRLAHPGRTAAGVYRPVQQTELELAHLPAAVLRRVPHPCATAGRVPPAGNALILYNKPAASASRPNKLAIHAVDEHEVRTQGAGEGSAGPGTAAPVRSAPSAGATSWGRPTS